jgi:hypothetical protein
MKLKLKSKLKKWKSVNDKLPKLGGQYLIVENMGDGNYPIPYMAFFDTFEQEWYEDLMMENKMRSGSVLFWMKLPKPPKGIPVTVYPEIPLSKEDIFIHKLLKEAFEKQRTVELNEKGLKLIERINKKIDDSKKVSTTQQQTL